MRAAIDTVDDCLAELANSVEAYSNLRAKLCCVIVDNSTVIADMSGACCVLSDNYSVTGEMTDIIDAFNEMTNRCQDLCTMYSMMWPIAMMLSGTNSSNTKAKSLCVKTLPKPTV